jgi:21S rRNA (uridine2791-2'-O)-methyltransferase
VSTIQGNFLSPQIQAEVRAYVQDPERGRPRRQIYLSTASGGTVTAEESKGVQEEGSAEPENQEGSEILPVDVSPEELAELERGYIDMERTAHLDASETVPELSEDVEAEEESERPGRISLRERDERAGRVVDVVLSDMSAPWHQTSGFFHNSVSDPYRRMMNTSGNSFRDHVRSMVRLSLMQRLEAESRPSPLFYISFEGN